MHRLFTLLLVICLCACTPTAHEPPEAELPAFALVPGPTGLQVLPDGREIGFGRDWSNVVETMNRLLGPADEVAACAGRGARWGDLILRHDGKRFVGLGCQTDA